MNRQFTKQDISDPQTHEKILKLRVRKMQMKTTLRYHFSLYKTGQN